MGVSGVAAIHQGSIGGERGRRVPGIHEHGAGNVGDDLSVLIVRPEGLNPVLLLFLFLAWHGMKTQPAFRGVVDVTPVLVVSLQCHPPANTVVTEDRLMLREFAEQTLDFAVVFSLNAVHVLSSWTLGTFIGINTQVL